MKAAYFISDLHLGASYLPSREHELKAVRFLDSIKGQCSELYLLGDILDYWYEYKTVVPRGYIRFFGALARLADEGVKITWFIGNHDIWLFDYLRNEIGMNIVDGFETREILGHKFFLSHGDGLGKLKPSFRLIRGIFRNKICQTLFSAIHPRWTIPFAHKWSNHSRDFNPAILPQFLGEKEPMVKFCREYLKDTDPTVEYFVFGHRHVLADYPLLTTGDNRMIILGDWIQRFSYGTFDGNEFKLHIFDK